MSIVNPLSTLDTRQPTSASILVLLLQFLRDPTQKRVRNKGAPTKHAVFQTISPLNECSSLVLFPPSTTSVHSPARPSLSPVLFYTDRHSCLAYTTTKQARACHPGRQVSSFERNIPPGPGSCYYRYYVPPTQWPSIIPDLLQNVVGEDDERGKNGSTRKCNKAIKMSSSVCDSVLES